MNSDVQGPGDSGPDTLETEIVRVMRFLRPSEVCRRTTLSPAHLYRMQTAGQYPRFSTVDGRACGNFEHEVDAWFAVRMRARENLPPIGYRPPLPPWQYRVEDVPMVIGIRLLRLREVELLVGLKRTQIYRLIRLGKFPAPAPLGERAARWVAHEVEAWLRARCPASRLPPDGERLMPASAKRTAELDSVPALSALRHGCVGVMPPA